MIDGIIANFHFLRPWMFILLIPLLLSIYYYKRQQSSLFAWQKVCEPELLDYLKAGVESTASTRTWWMLMLAGLLIVLALAGPVWKQLPQPLYSQQTALVVLLDLSRSMDAADVKPSRLIRAKQKLTDLLKLRREGQTALVVFAATAYVVTPLTEDNETILSQLQSLTTDIMPKQGGHIDAALEKALSLFNQAGIRHGDILLLTDSDSYSESLLKQVTALGHRLTVIGLGTTTGAPISMSSGGFLTDGQGNIVIAQLNESRLRALGNLGMGGYRPLALDNRDIATLISQEETHAWSKGAEERQTSDQWQEEGPWLLLLLIPFALLSFRRGVLVILLMLGLPQPQAEAGIWQDLWQTKDQQGEMLMQQQKYADAATAFTNPAWKATAAYRNQDYAAALQALDAIDEPSADDLYNKGNILAQLGRLDDAIKSYDAALMLDKNHADALANKTVLEKLKQQKQQQEKQKSSDSDSQKSDQQQGSQGEQQGQQQQSGSQEQQSDQQQQSGQQQGSQGQQPGSQGEQSDEQQQSGSQAQQSDQQQSDQQQSDGQQREQQAASQGKQQDGQPEEKQSVAKDSDKGGKPEQLSAQALQDMEAQQAFEQALRRVPDDPGGLLRRKFKYQYQRQTDKSRSGEEQW